RGEYAPGAQIPSETELSRELGMSRVTVREALRVLAQEGLLVKVQGRGTFVAESPQAAQPSRSFTGYLEDLYDQLERVSVKRIEITRVLLTEDVRVVLGLGEEEREVVRIKRTRHVDDEPYALTINLLPQEIGSRLEENALTQST